ncbi:hypothetical protein QYE76_051554 [Lolium multiflorum]|uniref:Reverse transcriptase domain-containing protein n=1 Tax=Lolium multiflorum TaxID=4521 RepID=A0AAD8ST10_LOLMU|nr:hypothetical protein QYE76_051554 [Lolium multiflorum]
MPFGLCNAPATFQCVMNTVLRPCLRRCVLVFMDDILFYSASVEEHVQHLREVLQLLLDHQLFDKESKCSFACDTLEYLGHIVSANGVATDPRKTQATVINRPYPKLAYKYFDPYKILDRMGQVSYRLELPEATKVHNVFHVSQLKEFRPDYTPVFAELPKLPMLDTTDTAPEKILNRRLVKKGNAARPQVLIKWLHLPEDTATWEDWDTLKAKFLKCLLGDKQVILERNLSRLRQERRHQGSQRRIRVAPGVGVLN